MSADDDGMRELIAGLVGLRRARGLTQIGVAALMDAPQSTVWRLENRPAHARLVTVQRYARALGARLSFDLDPPAPG